MSGITRNPLSRDDLLEIWTYIAYDNPDAADRLLDTLERKFEALARSPRMGRLRPQIAPNVRSFAVGNYLILYLINSDGIEIVRIIHGQRDLTKIKLQ